MYTQKLSSKEMRKKALKLLDDVGLKEKAKILPNKLSGGERQRVILARELNVPVNTITKFGGKSEIMYDKTK